MSENKDLQYLHELIRKANALITPIEMRWDLKWFMNADARQQMMETRPKCFVDIGRKDGGPVNLPICNQMGIVEPFFMEVSKRVTKRLKDRGDVDPEEADYLIAKLQRMKKRYEKDVPTPYTASVRKGNMTKFFNKIRGKLKNREY